MATYGAIVATEATSCMAIAAAIGPRTGRSNELNDSLAAFAARLASAAPWPGSAEPADADAIGSVSPVTRSLPPQHQ